MTTRSPEPMTRVVCRIFIKATPQAIWDAICPAARQYPESLSFELRDTLTGYTALTISCQPDGGYAVASPPTTRAYEWDRLLGDLKTVLEARSSLTGSGAPLGRQPGANVAARAGDAAGSSRTSTQLQHQAPQP